MVFNKNIYCAEFIKRPNRFQAYVKLNNEEIMVHVPNTGRCKEILVPGTTVILREENNPNRKTKYDLIAGYKEDKLINIDSHIPNKVVYESLKEGKIEKLREYKNIFREKTFGKSRFDFKLLNEQNKEYYLEVKGVTFEDDGYCMFPDAPTERGKKHLLELIDVKNSGRGAGVLFLIQMDEAKSFSPYDAMDKAFTEALRKAYRSGVDIFCYDCKVSKNYININKKVEIIL
ncbi:DNA/RNA nuclease SfsA [Clostridium aestuarii]|uniref:Sugar fermentation stimulation protein homolog n=1 Tax=Clostridium aestuarii TaxID=338193 RepID=A0ABT4D3V0_9CLOT|nr:DNA/RNA nuclease SfsA [Clostridium aestuarii]MCY6485929.1 DNA/RNA nuclease SfsA [Clostridium aestuarii]